MRALWFRVPLRDEREPRVAALQRGVNGCRILARMSDLCRSVSTVHFTATQVERQKSE